MRRDRFWRERHQMVENQIRRRGIADPRVLNALSEIPRHMFVPTAVREAAYSDMPLVIGHGQTISQPYIVALMTGALELQGSERVLEVGTGSGYQAAVLALLVAELHTVEIVPSLASKAGRLLRRLRCQNVYVHGGDGSLGWPKAAPYEAIIVTAAAPSVPEPLTRQLSNGGRLILPVASGDAYQLLTIVRRQGDRISEQVLASVAFVPLRGRYGVTN